MEKTTKERGAAPRRVRVRRKAVEEAPLNSPPPFTPLWDEAAATVAAYLRQARPRGDPMPHEEAGGGARGLFLHDDLKEQCQAWRVFYLAVNCLKCIQEGRIRSLAEAKRESERNEGGGESAAEIARAAQALLDGLEDREGADGDLEGAWRG